MFQFFFQRVISESIKCGSNVPKLCPDNYLHKNVLAVNRMAKSCIVDVILKRCFLPF